MFQVPHLAPLIRTCQVLHNVLPASVTEQMQIQIHLDLPTSSNPVPPIPPHTSPARTLHHSKRLKDPQTKDAFTSALAKKVANTSHTFSRLTTQFLSSQITPQSLADTANTALSEVLQHTAHVILGQVDSHNPKHEPDKSTAHHNANHHSSQNPQEAYLQSTIQHHQDAIHTLKKDIPLHYHDTLTFHRDKLKEAQDALDKV